MAAIDIPGFMQAKDQVALRVAYERLPGLLRKRLDVPEGAVALVRSGAGQPKLVASGASDGDLKDGVLLKTARVEIKFDVPDLRSKDGLDVKAALELLVHPRPTEIDLAQLERELLAGKDVVRHSDVERFFGPFVREAVRFYAGSRDCAALVDGDQRAGLVEHLRTELKKPLFEAGFELDDVLHPSFKSTAHDERKKKEADTKLKAEALEKDKELEELKRKLDKDAILKDLEAKDELDAARKEKRLKRYEDIRQKVGDDDLRALVLMIDDDEARASLIRDLIDKDMPPEQKAALKLGEMEQKIEARLREMQHKLAGLVGAELETGQDPITRRLLCVIGKRVLAYDPKTNLHPEVPKEVFDTETGALGYLRSVRGQKIGDGDVLLAGAQRGVYRVEGEKRIEYVFPKEPEGKGGANAVAYFDGRLYATHSELGLIEWHWDNPKDKGRYLCEDVTRGQTSTRGALIGADGRLYFSAGNDIFGLDITTGAEKPVRFKGSDDSITSFCLGKREVIAGNKNGRIYRWDLDDPGSPSELPMKKSNPIYMVRQAQIAGQTFLLIGSKDFTVTAAAPEKDVYREYHAREEVRWVDGAGDFIFGISRSGYKAFAWDVRKQGEPLLTIRVSDKVQDVFVTKERPKAKT